MGITFSRCQDLHSFLLWPRAWTNKSQNKPISDFSEQHLTCNLYKWFFPLIIVFWFFKISLPHWAGTILGDSNGVMLVVTDRLDIAQDFISLQPFHRKNIAVMAEVHCCTYSFLFKRHDTKHVKYKKPSRLVAAETSLKMAFHVNDLPFGERILGSSCINETRLLVISLGPPCPHHGASHPPTFCLKFAISPLPIWSVDMSQFTSFDIWMTSPRAEGTFLTTLLRIHVQFKN